MAQSTSLKGFEKLSPELRNQIYLEGDTLHQQDDGTLPVLLQALVYNSKLYNEALSIFMSINMVLSAGNEMWLRGLKMQEMLKFTSLRMVLPPVIKTVTPLQLRGNLITLRNNLRNIIIDISWIHETLPFQPERLAVYLVRASFGATRKLVLVFPSCLLITNPPTDRELADMLGHMRAEWNFRVRDGKNDEEAIMRAVTYLDNGFGFVGTLHTQAGGAGKRIWTWEGAARGPLVWTGTKIQRENESN